MHQECLCRPTVKTIYLRAHSSRRTKCSISRTRNAAKLHSDEVSVSLQSTQSSSWPEKHDRLTEATSTSTITRCLWHVCRLRTFLRVQRTLRYHRIRLIRLCADTHRIKRVQKYWAVFYIIVDSLMVSVLISRSRGHELVVFSMELFWTFV